MPLRILHFTGCDETFESLREAGDRVWIGEFNPAEAPQLKAFMVDLDGDGRGLRWSLDLSTPRGNRARDGFLFSHHLGDVLSFYRPDLVVHQDVVPGFLDLIPGVEAHSVPQILCFRPARSCSRNETLAQLQLSLSSQFAKRLGNTTILVPDEKTKQSLVKLSAGNRDPLVVEKIGTKNLYVPDPINSFV